MANFVHKKFKLKMAIFFLLIYLKLISLVKSQMSISTDKENYPYLGYLVCGQEKPNPSNNACLGILVSPMFILTTVQCFQSSCKEVHLLNDDKIYQPKEIFYPVDYEDFKRKNVTLFDVGLIKISPNVQLSSRVHVAKIASISIIENCVALWWNDMIVKIYHLNDTYGKFLECKNKTGTERCQTIKTYRPNDDSVPVMNLCDYRHKAIPMMCSGLLTGILYTQKCSPDELESGDRLMDIEWKLIGTAQKIITKVRDLEMRRQEFDKNVKEVRVEVTSPRPVLEPIAVIDPYAQDESATANPGSEIPDNDTEVIPLPTPPHTQLIPLPNLEPDKKSAFVEEYENYEEIHEHCVTHIKWGGKQKVERFAPADAMLLNEKNSTNSRFRSNFYILALLCILFLIN